MSAWLPSAEGWAALGTFLAVLVALFGDALRAKLSFLQPKLKLELIERPERSITNIVGTETYLDTFYYYGKVSNTNKRVKTATQVQVSLIRLDPKLANEGEELYAKEVPIEWHLQNVKPLQLTLGSDQNFLICSITQAPSVAIHPIVKPLALKRTWRLPFKAVIIFQAKSIEAESNLLPLEIEWDGVWTSNKEELSKHLKVRAISIDGKEPTESEMSDEDNQRLIAAGKVQRWEVLKWVTTVNMGLATASALISSREGKALVWEFLIAAGLMAFFGMFLLWHYNRRITGARKVSGYGGLLYDWQELLVFGLIIILSPIPAWLIAIR